MNHDARFHFFCGKMAAGKSTLAKKLAQQTQSVLLSEDVWLQHLYKQEITDISSYVHYSSRLKNMIKGHVLDLLSLGMTVILDFPANTLQQRQWFREIYQTANVSHALHYVVKNDAECKKQLQMRSRDLAQGAPFTTAKEFDAITQYFQEPADEEGFNIIRYR
jgi:predicted kinase